MSTEQKQKILIVDDSELNRAILADMLADEYEIIEAENGLQGVGLLQQQETEISLVLLDIVMPHGRLRRPGGHGPEPLDRRYSRYHDLRGDRLQPHRAGL